MKHWKKLLVVVAAVVMAMAMAAPAFADDDPVTSVKITSANGETGSVYSGFKLMDAVPDNAANPSVYTYTINAKYKNAVLEVLELSADATDSQIYDAIAAKDTAAAAEQFASDVYAKIKGMDADITINEATATNVPYGYWLFYESTIGNLPNNAGDGTATKLLLDTYAQSPAVTVTTKESYPTPEKEIVNGSLDTDSDTVAVGDTVTYQISTTLPAHFAAYDTYKLVFDDTMSTGLQFQSITSVTIAGKTADSSKYVVTEPTTSSNVLKVTWNDIKLDTNAAAGAEVVITYTVKITDAAVVGSEGNPNTLKIEYSNDPNSTGTGESTEIENKVYTFKIKVTKTDGNGDALNGAGFTLYKQNGTDWVAVGDEIVLTDSNVFNWTQLDAGSYKVVETTVPANYNKAADVEFTITATASEGDDTITATVNNELVSLDSTTYEASMTIKNQKGTELPSTGGMGTTILYIIGGIMVLLAVVFLITKKRVAATKKEASDDIL